MALVTFIAIFQLQYRGDEVEYGLLELVGSAADPDRSVKVALRGTEVSSIVF